MGWMELIYLLVMISLCVVVIKSDLFEGMVYNCILQSPADSDAFQSGRCAKHNGRPETMYF